MKKIKKNWVIHNYGDDTRLIIKTIGKWNITLSLYKEGYYPNQLMVDDGYNSYYMNSNKAWDNFYPIPKTVINWCENIGIKYLNTFLNEGYEI